MISFYQVTVRSILFALLYEASVESLVFLEEPTDTSVYVTEKATLKCRVDGLIDHHSIVWVKDNTQISYNNFKQHAIISPFEVIFNRGEGLCSIEIQHAEVSDSGLYICGVEYGNGQYKWSRRATLTVYEFFRRKPTNIGIYEGGTAILQCTANILRSGLSLLWMKDSETLTIQDIISPGRFGRIEIISNYTAGFYNISIKNVTLKDIGSYRCGLQLESGKIEWSREGMMTVLKRVNPVQYGISARPGDEIELTCEAVPFVPNQNLVWEKDMTTITWNEFVLPSNDRSSRLSVEMENYSYDLQLMLVENTDSGLYRCGVEFPNGLYHWITEVSLTVMAVSSASPTTTYVSTAGQAESATTSPIDVSTARNILPRSVPVSLPHSTAYSLTKQTTPTSTATYPSQRTSRSSTRPTTAHSMRDVPIQKSSWDGEELFVYIGVIVIITLAFVTFFLTCVILLIMRNEKRKKKSDENSPQEESTNELRAQRREAGHENPLWNIYV